MIDNALNMSLVEGHANEYIVNENETLDDIAMKLNLSPSRLQIINALYPPSVKPGDILKTEDPLEMTKCQHQIFVILSSNNIELPGIITFYPDSFVYEQRQLSLDYKKVVLSINIISVISCNIVPHPKLPYELSESPSEAAILILCYLADPIDSNSVEAISFVATRAELNVLKYHILHRSSSKQKAIHFSKTPRSVQAAKEKELELQEINKLPSKLRKSLPNFSRLFQLYGESKIIDKIDLVELRKALPFRMRSYSWNLIFSLSIDGSSFNGIFNATKYVRSCLMIIKTEKNEKLGAFLPNGLKYSSRAYGTGEMFVFTFNPTMTIYKWSQKNTSFISATMSEIMIGGGGGSAIWLDDRLLKGISEKCPTFDSPPLVSGSKFVIEEIEIWDICFK
ncbi:LysM domain containing protein [Tritrichomonas foetus]|uniref:Oxidation resistance protein 1 n=1 Tax=Tritrichomonas foetus TaxID=1144522 RepID=A0A1J4JQF4_9EUKA|nr:LysM domain containing protein [Tritrichomonas foetus]|eukprot:OHS99747.1 LysM domain containing protein [Tritrichomonas foetus]